ncbi:MAG: hypothetical protein H0V74_09875, partial [Chloroflexi bacterium]|nr:hypothetical protein [Chloroflexota bacterium]
WVVRALTASAGPAVARTFVLPDFPFTDEPAIQLFEVTEGGIAPVPLTQVARPSDIFGLPVVTVGEAIMVRDAGVDDRELAVRGWFGGIAVLSCPASIAPIVSPVEPSCPDPFTWITEKPEPPGTINVTGPAINPDFDDLDTGWMPRVTGAGPAVPVEIVAVGHFDDRRSAVCPAWAVHACRDRFVVDRVARVNGAEPPRSLVIEVEGLASTEDEVAAVVGNESPGGPVLSTAIVDGATGIGRIEPSLGTGRGGFIDQRAIWVVRVLEDSLTVTYLVVDGTDAIFEMRADGKPVAVGGTLPTPSEAPWPPEGATIVVLTSQVGAGRQPARVAVVDRSGRLTSVREKREPDPAPDSGCHDACLVRAMDGSYRLLWTGGVCDARLTVTIEAGVSRIVVDHGVRPGCDSMGIGRELVLDFSVPVDATTVEVFELQARLID